jgi:hypothetical protein
MKQIRSKYQIYPDLSTCFSQIYPDFSTYFSVFIPDFSIIAICFTGDELQSI